MKFLLWVVSASLFGQNIPLIRVDRVTAHVKRLASDEFEGRAPGTPGEEKSVDYIVSQLSSFGVKPAGDPQGNSRSWTQAVALAQSDIVGPVTVSLKIGDRSKALKQSEDIAIRSTMHPIDKVSVKDAPLVFVGYGVNAPERQWNDYKDLDLRGKIGIVLINDPDLEADLGGRFGGKAMTYYG